MIDKITVVESGSVNNTVLTDYLTFNRIPYAVTDFWNTDIDKAGGLYIPDELYCGKNHLLVMSTRVFAECCTWEVSRQRLVEFSKNNLIWVWNNLDGLVSYLTAQSWYNNELKEFKNINWFIDGELETLNDSRIIKFPFSRFLSMQRFRHGCDVKLNCTHDFLLTTVVKQQAKHRQILVDKLYQLPIKDNGLIVVHQGDRAKSKWVGETPIGHLWNDGYPSSDLYSKCWFEIVPETLYEDGYFYTEKTNKPIATQTPFLTLSTKGYLGYLKSLGFKTFNTLIDESYDTADTINDRVDLLLQQTEQIIKNGSESFYHAAKDILEYNQSHLCELTGKQNLIFDKFINKQLTIAGLK